MGCHVWIHSPLYNTFIHSYSATPWQCSLCFLKCVHVHLPIDSYLLLSLSLCSTSTTDSFTWPLPTTMTLSTSSAVLEVLSAWHLWVWCSLTTCCRTWREANRPRSCGSASPWRWQPSPPENVPGLGLGFEEPHPAPTQPPALLLPWHWAGYIHAVWFCQGPCSLLCGLTHKHSTQAVQSAPIPSTYRDFLFLCVCLSTQSSEEKPGQLPALLHSGKTPCSRPIMFHVCNCGIKVYSFLFFIYLSSSISPENEDIDGDLSPTTLTSCPVFCSFI